MKIVRPFFACCWVSVAALTGWAQTPLIIKLEDALARARQYGGLVQTANIGVLLAKEDSVQTRAARLPTVTGFNQFIYTQGNGTPSGVFVANDGVHVYNEQVVVHQEMNSAVHTGERDRALAAGAVARAKVEVAVRGLNGTVIQNYYAIVAAERRAANLEISVREAERFLDITQKQEKGGEAAHADVVKAQIDSQQRRRDLAEARISILKAKIGLGVLIFPTFTSDFEVVDDLQSAPVLPPLTEAQVQATNTSPELKVAAATVHVAGHEVRVARYQYLPSLALDLFYGIDANQFAFRTHYPAELGHEVPYRQNLGYVAQATLNVPIWNWGATRSKVKQAELKRDQARLDQTIAERTLQSNLATAYAEAQAAQSQLESLRGSVTLAVESLRLTLLRYQAGEATALEVVDSQNTVTQARNANDDGLARYRVAMAALQSLMGNL
jgi:outer membrane protein TolC